MSTAQTSKQPGPRIEHSRRGRRSRRDAAFDAFGSSDKTFIRAGVAEGFSVDFGHDDLLAGVAAPAEVFPRIAAWFAARSGVAQGRDE